MARVDFVQLLQESGAVQNACGYQWPRSRLVSSGFFALQREIRTRSVFTLQFTLQAGWTVFNMEAIEE
jgi:hypothetical protein